MLEPAHTVITICGGFAAVAAITSRSEVRVRRWCYPKDRGGTGGFIPTECQQMLLDWSRANGSALRPDHFFRPEKPEEDAA
jgi:hypothetical protein